MFSAIEFTGIVAGLISLELFAIKKHDKWVRYALRAILAVFAAIAIFM